MIQRVFFSNNKWIMQLAFKWSNNLNINFTYTLSVFLSICLSLSHTHNNVPRYYIAVQTDLSYNKKIIWLCNFAPICLSVWYLHWQIAALPLMYWQTSSPVLMECDHLLLVSCSGEVQRSERTPPVFLHWRFLHPKNHTLIFKIYWHFYKSN